MAEAAKLEDGALSASVLQEAAGSVAGDLGESLWYQFDLLLNFMFLLLDLGKWRTFVKQKLDRS